MAVNATPSQLRGKPKEHMRDGGFVGPRARRSIIERFASLPLLMPDRQDHVDAAELRNRCRRAGVQLGTIDAVLSQLCIRHGLTMLTADNDFVLAAKHTGLRVWR